MRMKSHHEEDPVPVLGDMPVEAFRKFGHRCVDWISEYMDRIEAIPVLPDIRPGDIRASLEEKPPENGESMETILSDIDRIVMPGMTHWNHPKFLAYFASTGSRPAILGEMLSAAFAVNAMLWKTCPAATEIEQTVLDWLRQMVGLPAGFWGITYDTASVSTMHALAAAREALTECRIRERGMAGRPEIPRLRVYASDQAHSSVDKAAITLGIGLENVKKIPTDEAFRMRPEELEHALDEDRKEGWLPACVVTTVGTTSTTSIDPVPEIADICMREEIWHHVDAAYGGSAAVVPELRHILDGCDRADSIVINPHKWMFVPIDFSAFYTRRPDVLRNAFSHIPEYLRTADDDKVENLMDFGLQLGRRFRALKMWFVIRYFGKNGIATRIREHVRLAQAFASWVDAHPDFSIMAPHPFGTVCFRAQPEGAVDTQFLNRLNQRLLEEVNSSRDVYLSHTVLNGKFVLRISVGHLQTQIHHLREAWERVKSALQAVTSSSEIDGEK